MSIIDFFGQRALPPFSSPAEERRRRRGERAAAGFDRYQEEEPAVGWGDGGTLYNSEGVLWALLSEPSTHQVVCVCVCVSVCVRLSWLLQSAVA